VGDEKLSMADAVAPVPLHPARRRERGYNQSELIAGHVGRVLGLVHLPDLLMRVRQTQTQTSFDADGRMRNVRDAFRLGEAAHAVDGKRVLLIDDVITTGATIKECARTLKAGGASKVYAASAAIAI